METERRKYTKQLYLKKVGTGVEYIDDNLVKTGETIRLTCIACENETTGLTYMRFGKVTAGYFHLWEEQKNPAAGELVYTTEEHWVWEDEHFRCAVSGGAANDIIRVYLDGYYVKGSE